MKKHTVQIANILLTRRCNLACSYCGLVCGGGPVEYPDMRYFHQSEMSSVEWIETIKRLKLNNPNCFFIFYGGEPFLYFGLEEILTYCNNNNVLYTVISNNTAGVQKRISDVYEEAGTFQGFTSSVDPILFNPNADKKDDIWKKSNYGFLNLLNMKKSGMAKDVVAEITVTNNNKEFLVSTVQELSKHGIYSSITCIDDKKTDYYDFSNIRDQSQLIQPTDEIRDIFNRLQQDSSLLIHIPSTLNDIYNCLPSKMKCCIYRNIHNVTVDADGSFRLCLRIMGVKTPCLKLNNVISPNGDFSNVFIEYIKRDYKQFCRGCNWTCMLMSKLYSENIHAH